MVKVRFMYTRPTPGCLFLIFIYLGRSTAGMEARLLGIQRQTQWTDGQRAHRAEYFREGRSLRVPAYPKEIAVSEGIQGEDGSIRQDYRWTHS